MARLELYTSEKYSVEISDELYTKYINGEIDDYGILDRYSDIIWDCNQYADIVDIKIEETNGN